MSSMLGISQADTDMASSFDFDYSSTMAPEAVGEDFDIDLTYEEHGEPLDAVMADEEEHAATHESEMFDSEHAAHDEPMIENTDDFVELDYIEEEVIVTTPKIVSTDMAPASELVTDTAETHDAQPTLESNHSHNAEEVREVINHSSGEDLSYDHAGIEHDISTYEDPYRQDAEQGINFGDEEEAVHVFDDHYGNEGTSITEFHDDGGEEEVIGHYEENLAEEDEEDPFASAADADFFETAEHAEPEKTPQDGNHTKESDDSNFAESFKYQCTMEWQELGVPLFKTSSTPTKFFSDDISLAEKDFSTFFKAIREILKSQVGDEEILEIQVPQLDLKIDENSYDCADSSLIQMLELYYKLHANDGVDEPEPLNLVLCASLRYSARINELFEAAEANKGYAEVLNYHEDVDEAVQANNESQENVDQKAADEEREADGDQYTYGEHGDDENNVEQVETHKDDTQEADGEETYTEEQHNTSEVNQPDEGLEQSIYLEAHEQLPTSANESIVAPTVNTEIGLEKSQNSAKSAPPTGFSPILGENDEISYDDDPAPTSLSIDENQEPTLTEKSADNAKIVGQPTEEDTAVHEEFVIDFSTGDDVSAATDHNGDHISGQPSATGATEATSATNTVNMTADEEYELELERSFSDEALSTSNDKDNKPTLERRTTTEEDDEIDWDDEEDVEQPAPKASAGAGSSPSTPLGKRSREDDQSGEQVAVDSGQEVKRVKA